jgi:hypothetical protein
MGEVPDVEEILSVWPSTFGIEGLTAKDRGV